MPAPKMGTRGTRGALNGLDKFGFCRLKTIIPTQTITNASKVPMETNSPRILMGSIPANTNAIIPVMIWLIYGVLNLECTFENIGGNNPSFDIE